MLRVISLDKYKFSVTFYNQIIEHLYHPRKFSCIFSSQSSAPPTAQIPEMLLISYSVVRSKIVQNVPFLFGLA